jgi:RimJ/RimL family protein N-acetyltransferase
MAANPIDRPPIPLTDFDSRWAPLASLWGLSPSDLHDLFCDDSFTMVPFVKSEADYQAYAAIRCNAGGNAKYLRLYADGVIPDEAQLLVAFSQRVDRQFESQSVGLFLVARSPETGEYEAPAWIVGGRFNPADVAQPRGAEIAFMKLETWRARDGLVTKGVIRFVEMVRRLCDKGIFHVEYLYATCHKDNVKSFNLLTKSGFELDKNFKDMKEVKMWGDVRHLFTLKL